MNLKEKLVSILQTDAQSVVAGSLGVLLGHQATAPYGVFFTDPPTKPDFPLIVYALNTRHGRMPHIISFSISVYGGDVDAIHSRIEALLHEKQSSFTDLSDYYVRRVEHNWDGPDDFDEKMRVSWRQARYLFYTLRK